MLKEKIETTNELTSEEKERITPYGFGHMADGDIHITIIIKGEDHVAAPLREKVINIVDQFLVSYVAKKRGSVSGEHGIG